jgi:hypothetical protein
MGLPRGRRIGDLAEIASMVRRILERKRKPGMGDIWTFIRKPSNQKLLTWLGGGGVVAATGIWAVVTYVWPAHEAPKVVCAQHGSVAGGRDASGNTVTYNGALPAGGGTVTCAADTTKK